MHLFHRKWCLVTFVISVFAIAIWLSIEFHSPEEIVSTSIVLPGGLEASRTPDLMVHYIGEDHTIWGVRGYQVYKSSTGVKFKRAFKVPSGNLIPWLGNFRFIRALTKYSELCEIFPLRSGTILAFSGGYIWRSTDGRHFSQRVHKLGHFGVGVGRGVMPQGMTEDKDGVLYYGEYFFNSERGPVLVYRSMDDGKNWEVAYRFNPGEIRHIHSLQFDRYTNALWIATGDDDHECMIGYSTDKGVTFEKIGSGGQKWRAVSLLFTKDAVFWGTDSPHSQNWIYRWDRKKRHVEQVQEIGGPIYYSTELQDGTLVMGRTVEGGEGERDEMVSMWLSRGGEKWTKISFGNADLSLGYGFLRLPRGKAGTDLYLTLVNVDDHDEVLLKIPLETIVK